MLSSDTEATRGDRHRQGGPAVIYGRLVCCDLDHDVSARLEYVVEVEMAARRELLAIDGNIRDVRCRAFGDRLLHGPRVEALRRHRGAHVQEAVVHSVLWNEG